MKQATMERVTIAAVAQIRRLVCLSLGRMAYERTGLPESLVTPLCEALEELEMLEREAEAPGSTVERAP